MDQPPSVPMWSITRPGLPPQQVRTTPHVTDAVHYVSYGTPGGEYPSVCRAAIVTVVYSPTHLHQYGVPPVGLCVFNPEGIFFNQKVAYHPGTYNGGERQFTPGEPVPVICCDDLEFNGGTWHWPS